MTVLIIALSQNKYKQIIFLWTYCYFEFHLVFVMFASIDDDHLQAL